MRFSPPPWLPLKALMIQGVLTLSALLFILVPLWYLSQTQQQAIADLTMRVQVQEILQPLMEGIASQKDDTQQLLGDKMSLPTPKTLPQIMGALQQMAQHAGMDNARFVPAAETVVERSSIRLDGTLAGTPDSFRRLILLFSEQTWLSGMSFLNIVPTAENTSYSMSIWATFRQKDLPTRPAATTGN